MLMFPPFSGTILVLCFHLPQIHVITFQFQIADVLARQDTMGKHVQFQLADYLPVLA